MRRTTALKAAAAGSALALAAVGGASAFADTERSEATGVVNKNGKQVDEHAADGQARATEARAQRLLKTAERAEAKTDNGNHGGPDVHAGDHPNPKAFENPQEQEPRGKGAQGPKNGHGPNEHADDHPNVNATDGPGTDHSAHGGRGGK